MTRKIPWRDGGSAKNTPRGSPAQPSPASRQFKRVKVERDIVQKELEDVASSLMFRSKASKLNTSASSNSRPSEPIKENFMVDGLDKDDKYRMVEDEFNFTAGQFTAHLHKAEYERLQDETKSQNATKIRNISRPVVGRATELVRTKQERISRLQRQKSATRKKSDVDEDEDDDNFRSTTLFGLMESPRKKPPMLDHFARTSTSRTLFGAQKAIQRDDPSLSMASRSQFSKSRPSAEKLHSSTVRDLSSDDDDDDLEAAPRSRPISFPPQPTMTNARAEEPATTQKAVQSPKYVQPREKLVHAAPKPAVQLEGPPDTVQSSDDDSDGALFGFQKRAKDRARHKAMSTKTSK